MYAQPRLVHGRPAVSLGREALRLLWPALAAAGIALAHGFPTPPLEPFIIGVLQLAFLALYWTHAWLHGKSPSDEPARLRWPAMVLLGLVGLALLGTAFGVGGAWHLAELSIALTLLAQLWRLNGLLSQHMNRPGLLFPVSFLVLIGVGTLLLKLPVATPDTQPINWGDALFTMTSAVCVTGLTVRDTADGFTPFGQLIIALFMQLGGLGILIFGSTLALLLGGRLSMHENANLSRMLQDQPLDRLNRFAIFIVLTTLTIEAIGAALMYPLWDSPDQGVMARLGYSAFHAISAFCNAGFDLTDNSLTAYRYSVLAHGIVLPLIVLGGLGFPVLDNIVRVALDRPRRWWRRRQRQPGRPTQPPRRLTLHTKLVVTTTAALYLLGVVTLGAGQLMPYFHTALQQGQTANVDRPEALDAAALGRVAADSSFLSLTARTAGFTTVSSSDISSTGRVTLMALMVVGGSPGSTAGGFKTTVLALLVLSVIGTLRPNKETEAFGRSIDDRLLRQAGTVAVTFVGLIVVATLLLTLSESFLFEKILFEVISAAGTVGLSLGITSDLSSFGQAVLIATMFLGRIGPLTLVGMVLLRQGPRRRYHYAREEVALG
jgi:trk system potassium uptake protein TrkH